jgi:hypothetical protein
LKNEEEPAGMKLCRTDFQRRLLPELLRRHGFCTFAAVGNSISSFRAGALMGMGENFPCAKRATFSGVLLELISRPDRLIVATRIMWGFGKEKERERYYLLPGQGGRASRRKHRRILLWSIIFGLVASAVCAGVLYLISNPIGAH